MILSFTQVLNLKSLINKPPSDTLIPKSTRIVGQHGTNQFILAGVFPQPTKFPSASSNSTNLIQTVIYSYNPLLKSLNCIFTHKESFSIVSANLAMNAPFLSFTIVKNQDSKAPEQKLFHTCLVELTNQGSVFWLDHIITKHYQKLIFLPSSDHRKFLHFLLIVDQLVVQRYTIRLKIKKQIHKLIINSLQRDLVTQDMIWYHWDEFAHKLYILRQSLSSSSSSGNSKAKNNNTLKKTRKKLSSHAEMFDHPHPKTVTPHLHPLDPSYSVPKKLPGKNQCLPQPQVAAHSLESCLFQCFKFHYWQFSISFELALQVYLPCRLALEFPPHIWQRYLNFQSGNTSPSTRYYFRLVFIRTGLLCLCQQLVFDPHEPLSGWIHQLHNSNARYPIHMCIYVLQHRLRLSFSTLLPLGLPPKVAQMIRVSFGSFGNSLLLSWIPGWYQNIVDLGENVDPCDSLLLVGTKYPAIPPISEENNPNLAPLMRRMYWLQSFHNCRQTKKILAADNNPFMCSPSYCYDSSYGILYQVLFTSENLKSLFLPSTLTIHPTMVRMISSNSPNPIKDLIEIVQFILSTNPELFTTRFFQEYLLGCTYCHTLGFLSAPTSTPSSTPTASSLSPGDSSAESQTPLDILNFLPCSTIPPFRYWNNAARQRKSFAVHVHVLPEYSLKGLTVLPGRRYPEWVLQQPKHSFFPPNPASHGLWDSLVGIPSSRLGSSPMALDNTASNKDSDISPIPQSTWFLGPDDIPILEEAIPLSNRYPHNSHIHQVAFLNSHFFLPIHKSLASKSKQMSLYSKLFSSTKQGPKKAKNLYEMNLTNILCSYFVSPEKYQIKMASQVATHYTTAQSTAVSQLLQIFIQNRNLSVYDLYCILERLAIALDSLMFWAPPEFDSFLAKLENVVSPLDTSEFPHRSFAAENMSQEFFLPE